ncbi:MAG: WecB/TagA/CpsF family glycosyltransferase [Eubacteriales bacterium]|nr:WecB/TagA/CpsF family glycosyltransferase [Eubacteriales bacterium]
MLKQPLLNTYVNNLNFEEAVRSIDQLILKGIPAFVVEINVDVVLKLENDSYFKEIADRADMVLVDGQPLVWIAKWHKRPVKEKVSGSDLVLGICKLAQDKGYTIFILGGRNGVSEQAAENLRKDFPDIVIAGTYEPPLGFDKDEEELKKINHMISRVHPDILLACLGCPKQEKWIFENYLKYGAKVSVCAGATVDFLAGRIKRAPKWMSNHGLEWFYRFLNEPRRLFKRYFIDDIKIIRLIWKYRNKE